MGLTRPAWSKVNVLILGISFWFFWNYWLDLFFYTSVYLFDAKQSAFLGDFYTAGQAWLAGANPYAISQITFVYPPTSLPFFGMFALFDPESSAVLWMLTYFSLFALALTIMAFTIKGERRFLFVCLVVLLFFSSFPLLYMIEISEVDLIVASLTILSLAAERFGRRFLSAFLLSVGTLMKLNPIFLLIYFVIFRRDLKYLIYFVVSMVVTIGVSLLAVPVQLYWYYLVNILPHLYAQYGVSDTQSIIRFLWLAGLEEPFLQVVSITGVVFFAIFAFYVNSNRWRNFGNSTIRGDAMFLMNGLVVLFFSPRSYISPYAWVIMPLGLFLSSLLMENSRSIYLLLISVATFLLNSQPTGFTGWFLNTYFVSMVVPTITIGNLVMIIGLIPIFLRPTAIFHGIKNQLIHRKQNRPTHFHQTINGSLS